MDPSASLRRRGATLLVVTLCSVAAPAAAFNSASQFYDPPGVPHSASTSASAEGIYFTGAPRFASQTCTACHVDGPGRVTIGIGAEPATLFTTGYEPGMIYELEIQLRGESRGTDYATPTCTEPLAPTDKYTYLPCNNNNFALEIDTVDGPLGKPAFCAVRPAGGACPAAAPSSDDVEVAPGGDAVFGNHAHSQVAGMEKTITKNGQTSWRFFWTAPPSGTGPLTLYVGAVDGNGGNGTTANDQDPYNDDVVSAAVTLQESGDPTGFDAVAGCAFGGPAEGSPNVAIAALVLVGWLAARRRRVGGKSAGEGSRLRSFCADIIDTRGWHRHRVCIRSWAMRADAAICLTVIVACAACLPRAQFVDPTDHTDLGAGVDMASTSTVPTAYFNPDIQKDLDTLGCTSSSCHGANASPVLTRMPAAPADWQANYNNIHIDCTTLDCLAGGPNALLLQKPLVGGAAHGGTKPFASTADPVYQRWLAWIDAGAPLDASADMAVGGTDDLATSAGDMAKPADMGKQELVTITFTTSMSPSAGASPYDPKNVVAVWIEAANGTFVKTAARWANTRKTKLVAWTGKAGTADVDAVSGATNAAYGTLTAKWDMTARAGGAAPVDGIYTIRMELADSNATVATDNNQGTFTFNRNGTASTQSALSNGGFTNVGIVYSGR